MNLPLVGPLLLVWGFGLGVFNDAQKDPGQMKQLEVGLEKRMEWVDFKTAWGKYFDATGFKGATDSWYVLESMEIGPRFPMLELQASFGVAYLGRADTVNGSNFEFVPGAEVTFVDSRRVQVGAYFEHFSNAGLWRPNLGRSFAGVRVKI